MTSIPHSQFDRRRFLGLVGAVGMTAPLLAACGGGSGSGTSPTSTGPSSFAPPRQTVRGNLQLGWFPNVESAPFVVAKQRGYYSAGHVDLTLQPGGPTVTIAPLIVAGNALTGVLAIERLADAVLQGAKLKAVGAVYQTSSSCILSLAKAPIQEPKDLEGKRFGISAADAQTYGAFFKMSGVDPSKVTMVQVGADPASLVSGEVDAMSAVIPNQPVALAQKGIKTHELHLADFGYHRWSSLLVVAADALADPVKRSAIGVILQGSQRALTEQMADPDAAAKIVFDLYGQNQGLDLSSQQAAIRRWNEIASTPEQHGHLRVTPQGVQQTQEFLSAIGVKIDASSLFDTSLGDEVFHA
ncbi:ABC transporter substrate-binding protein [Sphaerisporangium sp. NPDC088356]|uniref:ABC transporter substrate-binding protein n=1 Tax=Sphaerisporangium sp. NPDC088356 TaxID=3154871 RepID=UPI003428485D